MHPFKSTPAAIVRGGVPPINRIFVVAMSVALLCFGGELLTRTFTLPVSVLRVGSALVPFIFAPAIPLRLLVPGLSLTVYLIVACLGWGVLAQLFVVIRQGLQAR